MKKAKHPIDDKTVGRPIRLNRQTLEVNNEGYAEVVFLGDTHYGSPQCSKKKLLSTLDYCRTNHIYIFLMGDLIEMSTRDSIGSGVYEQESIGQSQYDDMVDMLQPVAGLILGFLRGNHEKRVYDRCGIDLARSMAKELKVPYLYDAGWSQFRVGTEKYEIYSLHGRTAAQYDGTVLKVVENISASFYADLVAMAHAHKLVKGSLLIEAVERDRVVQREKFIVCTGSYLEYDGGYWQERGGRISKLGSPKVRFCATRHDVSVF
jgi:hypothetical protein